MADVKDFLSPNAMLTPGIAGGLTVSIALPLALNFDVSFKWCALVISFLLGIVAVSSFTDPLSKPLRMVYCLLNSLIIFSVSAGVGSNIDPPPSPPSVEVISTIPHVGGREKLSRHFGDIIPDWLGVAPAFADEPAPVLVAPALTEPPASHVTGHDADMRGVDTPPPGPDETARFEAQRERVRQRMAAERLQQQYQAELKRYRKRWSW